MRECLKVHKTWICGNVSNEDRQFLYHLNSVLIQNQLALQKTEKLNL